MSEGLAKLSVVEKNQLYIANNEKSPKFIDTTSTCCKYDQKENEVLQKQFYLICTFCPLDQRTLKKIRACFQVAYYASQRST